MPGRLYLSHVDKSQGGSLLRDCFLRLGRNVPWPLQIACSLCCCSDEQVLQLLQELLGSCGGYCSRAQQAGSCQGACSLHLPAPATKLSNSTQSAARASVLSLLTNLDSSRLPPRRLLRLEE